MRIYTTISTLMEFKASIDRGDLLELYRIGQLYEKVTSKKPELLTHGIPAIRRRLVI